MINITTNGYDIIESGQVLSSGLEPIEFKFSENFNVRIKVILNSSPTPNVETEIIDGKILDVRFVNPHIILSFGTPEPFSIGTLENVGIYASFRINAFGPSNGEINSYNVMYTFYKRGE